MNKVTLSNQKGTMIWVWILTSWPLPEESLLTCLMGFLPNLRIEFALKMSFSVVLLIGIVPSGQNSPEADHNWWLSATSSMDLLLLGLSGGSCSSETSNSLNQPKKISPTEKDSDFELVTNGECPLSSGWSKAGWRWERTQSMTSPSELCNRTEHNRTEQNKTKHSDKNNSNPDCQICRTIKNFEKNQDFFYLNCLDWRFVDFA